MPDHPGADLPPRLTFQRCTFVLVLTGVDDDAVPVGRRLAALLKTAWRRDRLKAVYAVEAAPGAQTAADHAQHARDLITDLAQARAEVARLKDLLARAREPLIERT